MSQLRLLVRDANRDWSGIIHACTADRAVAALSADPMTMEELAAACARFERPPTNRAALAHLSDGFCVEPYDAGIVVIDLVARLVAVDSTYSSPAATGTVCYHNGQHATDIPLRYHLADDWLFVGDHCDWQALAEQRRRESAARPPLDARTVFYDRPLLEFVARGTFAAFAKRRTISSPTTEEQPDPSERLTDDDGTYDTLRQIHVDWLLTPRDDLGGACPREVAFEGRDHLTWDLQDQCERWSALEECPPGLDRSSFAFRYGGFGTHELVQYYHLVRELLYSCWGRLVELEPAQPAARGPHALTVGDFLTNEVLRLARVREEWLDRPDPECHGRTPRSIIDRERARLPEGMSGHDAIVDPDCPCCQMLADLPGPMFWHLDGSGMDEDFAFDLYHRTREEWEADQREWEERHRRFSAEWAERERLGVTSRGPSGKSVWSSSFSVGDADDVPLGVRLFGIGTHLAELIVDIRGDVDVDGASAVPQAQQRIDQLNRDFGNLRDVLQTSEPSLAETLIEPVIDRFAESLAAVAESRPDLSAKCDSLTGSLTRFLEPHSPESPWEDGDLDDPF